MNKQVEKLKEQLHGIADAVNAFESEIVQVRVIERLLPQFYRWNTAVEREPVELQTVADNEPVVEKLSRQNRPMGATRIIQQLLATDYFDTPRTLSEITDYCTAHHEGTYYTNTTSGVLLKFVKQNVLARITEGTGVYVYLK